MNELLNKTIDSRFVYGTGGTIEDWRFIDCNFVNCGLSLTDDIEKRTLVKRIELANCRANGCHIGPAIIEDVSIFGFQTNDLLILWGPLFRRVKLAGPIGKIKINSRVRAFDVSDDNQKAFDDFRLQYYSETDWALDIREAKFAAFELKGIPSRLVRRNPDSQVVITRERALNQKWRDEVSATNQLYPFMIDMFLADGEEDRILVAPLNVPKHTRDKAVKQLEELRKAGVACPD